jgi:hypothetical protein
VGAVHPLRDAECRAKEYEGWEHETLDAYIYIYIYLLDVLTLFNRLFVQGMSKLNQRNQISSFQTTWTCTWKNHPLCARFEVHTVVLLRGFKFSGSDAVLLDECFYMFHRVVDDYEDNMIQSPNDTPAHTRRLESKALFMIGLQFNNIFYPNTNETFS